MSRGPTRRLRQLVDAGHISAELLAAAGVEADLRGHPYIGVEHVELACLRQAGSVDAYAAMSQAVRPGLRRRWWRPRGPRSAMRRSGRRETAAAQNAARLRLGLGTTGDPTHPS